MKEGLRKGELSEEETANCREIGCRLLQTDPFGHCAPSLVLEQSGLRKQHKRYLISAYSTQIPENCTRDYHEKYLR